MTDSGPDTPIVVVADDDPTMRRLFSRALTDAGYQVLLAINVAEAMDQLRRPGVAAAILDMLFINSGGRSGLDLLHFVRNEPGITNLPVIVVTGFPLNNAVTAQVEALHAEVWHKPFELFELTRKLDRLVNRT
jgi:CheY-like chemotaxis protein